MPHAKYRNAAGKVVPSVTTIIGEALGFNKRTLMAWQNRLWEQGKDPRKELKRASDIGTVTHEMIEAWVKGDEEYEQPEEVDDLVVLSASEGLRDFIKWVEDNKVEFLENELKMVSEELQFGGTADAIAMIDGKKTLIDFKTSKGVYLDHIVQLGAYKYGIEETTDHIIEQCMVVKIDKGEIEEGQSRIHVHYIKPTMVERGLNMFKMARKLKDIASEVNSFLRKESKKCL